MKTFGYSVGQGMKNIWKNRLFSLAAIGTVVTCLFLLGLFYVLVSNFQNMVYNAESSVGLTVFFDEGISKSDIENIGKKIEACKDVSDIKYISAKSAWKKFQKEISDNGGNIAETFGDDNPLKDSASFEVYLSDVSRQENIVNFIEKIPGVRKVNGSTTVANGLNNVNMLIAYVSASIIILLLFVSLFLISTAVSTGIHVRKDEIAIMKYIGATDSFVKMPFLVEGIIIGVIGAVIPLGLLWVLYDKMIEFLLERFSVLSRWLTFVSPGKEFSVLIPLSLGVGVGIGFFGSYISVRKHLRK